MLRRRSSVVWLVSVASVGCFAEGQAPKTAVVSSPACTVEVPMRRLTPQQYAHAILDLFDGAVEPSARFPEQAGRSVTGFSTEPGLNGVDALAAEQILLAAEDVALQIPGVLDCNDEACAARFLDRLTTRAFRRPPTEAEQDNLREVFAEARADEAEVEEAAAMTVAVILQSPQFLYTIEVGASDAPVRALTSYEIATRLALLLWDSIPDDALLAAAAEGRLETSEGVLAEARRMLADAKAERMSRRFFREWMHVDALTAVSRDPARHDWYDAAFAASIGESFDRFVHRALTEGWTTDELLTASSAPVDDLLAEHYGVAAPSEPWSWVDVDPERAVGVMTQPAVMASLAHYDESSYVRRGHFVVSGLLCRSLGDPPANATQEAVQIESWLRPGASRRELSRAVQRRTECGSCHLTLDPPGLAFEHFDATGRWRDHDAHGNPIDASGEIGALRLEFSGARELMEGVADRFEARECVDRQVFRFFASRTDEDADRCLLERMQSSGGSVRGGLMTLVGSDAFRYRRMGSAEGTP